MQMALQIKWEMFKATCRQVRHTDEMMRGYLGILTGLSKSIDFGSIPISKMSANNSSGNLDIWDGSLDIWGGSLDIWGGSLDIWGGSLDIWGGSLDVRLEFLFVKRFLSDLNERIVRRLGIVIRPLKLRISKLVFRG
jgi:hypothetical protein